MKSFNRLIVQIIIFSSIVYLILRSLDLTHAPPPPKRLQLDCTTTDSSNANDKITLVVYSYFESAHSLPNLQFFIRLGVNPLLNNSTVHFVFILTSKSTVSLPVHAQNVWVRSRANYGLDFCSWHTALVQIKNITNRDISYYSHVIIMNGSVRGPFMHQPSSWISFFIGMITSNTRLAGTSIHCGGPRHRIHIQSMILVFDVVIGLPIVLDNLICAYDRNEGIMKSEVGISQAFIAKGYNLASSLSFFSGGDFTVPHPTVCRPIQEFCMGFLGDIYYPNACPAETGIIINPMDGWLFFIVFIVFSCFFLSV